jgi:hypothetical protein
MSVGTAVAVDEVFGAAVENAIPVAILDNKGSRSMRKDQPGAC